MTVYVVASLVELLDAYSERDALLVERQRDKAAIRALARLVREEFPSRLSLAQIADTWGDASEEELAALVAVDKEEAGG